ncbi:unnamed protein product [Adineta ricciae]|uniref:Uncharacterized protein n=1 Tax=Adineta ricciae TaxID=249248 RepID=A0A814JFX7_ADIRI|nr:unnamed protein product [Adineta ricciae]CAF1036911.1 unnamed protein product [Adineta ricciae]
MVQIKIVALFFIFCGFLTKCHADVRCDQYANDLDILSKLPFPVGLDYKKQGPDRSTAILDPTNSTVNMIQLRQAGKFVPESVFCLKKLQALDIRNMLFVDGVVPDALSNLQEVHTLGIANTPITKMTEKLSSLVKLQSLMLDNCSLTQLPSLSELKNLTTVSLPNNRLTQLEGLVKVRSLSLYKNQFTEIPMLEIPEALGRLDMNHNPVMDMSYLLLCKNITEIRIAVSNIPMIPSHIALLKRLSFLDLANTKITHVPRNILNLPYLQFLVVQNNAIPKEEADALKMDILNRQLKVSLLI